MCTVTFIPFKDKICLTSNRDEKSWRSPALPPAVYPFKSGNIIFPKDTDGGGTWFAVHENGNAVTFLNGAFVRHEPNPPYSKSRGLILLEIIDSSSPYFQFREINLENIEPFTAIIRDESNLYECRWDGNLKHIVCLNAGVPHIWSSATLYDETIIEKRKKWFTGWIMKNNEPQLEDILHFHEFTGEGDIQNDLKMNREGKVFTVSITGAVIEPGNLVFKYIDLITDSKATMEFELLKASV